MRLVRRPSAATAVEACWPASPASGSSFSRRSARRRHAGSRSSRSRSTSTSARTRAAWVAALLIADFLPTFAIGLLLGPLIDRLAAPLADGRRRPRPCRRLRRAAVRASAAADRRARARSPASRPASSARPSTPAIPNLVPDEDLPAANALLQRVENVTWALGPVVGGVLAAAAGADAAYWINAATFLALRRARRGIPARLLQAATAASARPLARPRRTASA